MRDGNSDTFNSSEFNSLLSTCIDISSQFPDGIVYIGGIAVYLHIVNSSVDLSLAEATHDADFYISLADLADLRDIEEVTNNRRLNRHQIRKNGFEFDIYAERHSALIVPYDAVKAHCVRFDEISVACLEHLVALKLEAFRDRRASTKGQKDAKDIIRIGLAAEAAKHKIKKELILPYISDEHIELLKNVAKGPEFLSLARGNAKYAKDMRKSFQKAFEVL